ncbi:hypothetical protein AWJ07_01195 [Shewanella frigidimarina]|uniref:Uncharacterized protein n=1 Tax=Shewanella frigidimarina TaxID=56812 RepID=A0A119D0N6_SHEFR|nr:hypothetical protein AWJ07_01195 [Shewanella frigidimarina]
MPSLRWPSHVQPTEVLSFSSGQIDYFTTSQTITTYIMPPSSTQQIDFKQFNYNKIKYTLHHTPMHYLLR